MRHLTALAIALCVLASPAVSAGESWKQLSGDMFIDTSSIVRSFKSVHADVKYLYDKADGARLQKTFRSKLMPQHSIQRKNFYCNNREVSTSAYKYFAADGTVLATGSISEQKKTPVVPESRIEVVFDYVCQQR
ncbi:MAG: hypothetical protein RDU24_12660 [Humidesulfovibrio sp.]|uniref:surface-adhesin E family protein n=1 Tax=Humidesulfovibrio sp. TaxID=2910988 RepID=UPI0028004544|nr:surface-adhesin E family protein [Humidesulfovibrio sp.]MDQ7836226.1 hypothetical protein [Humidesulfovibrio sp.]